MFPFSKVWCSSWLSVLLVLFGMCYIAGYLRGEQGSQLEMGKASRVKFRSVEMFSFDIFRRTLQRGRIGVKVTLLSLEMEAVRWR